MAQSLQLVEPVQMLLGPLHQANPFVPKPALSSSLLTSQSPKLIMMDPNKKQYGVVLVTAAVREEAVAIAQTLVESGLAACISFFPIHSTYVWNGKVENNDEWQLVIKTDLTRFDALEAKIREIHSYEVPEIIALPILAGSPAYLNWISEQITV